MVVHCSVTETFAPGVNNYIQWGAKDTAGNEWVPSPEINFYVDNLPVTFSEPTPTEDEWVRNHTVTCSIYLNDSGGSYDGLSDLYLGYIRPGLPGDITFKAFLHWFLDDGFGKTYGYEADAVAVKKLNEWSSLLLKLAYFRSDDEAYGDIRQASLQFDFKY